MIVSAQVFTCGWTNRMAFELGRKPFVPNNSINIFLSFFLSFLNETSNNINKRKTTCNVNHTRTRKYISDYALENK